MRKNILIITTLLCLIGFATACENKITDANDYVKKDDDTLQGSESLVGTKWKLLGFFDVDKNELKELEHEFYYTLEFLTDSNVSGQGYPNIMAGEYIIDYSSASIIFSRFIATTFAMGHPDEELYSTLMLQVRYFSFMDNELKLFHSNKKNYLLFRRLL